MIQRVRRVICPDTGRDVTELFNDAAARHDFDAVGFLGGAIAESGLAEHAPRERAWPDVSYGLFQPTVKWHGKVVPGVELAADGTVADTPRNRDEVRLWFSDAERSIRYVAPLYAALLRRWGNPLEAWCRWNKPAIAGIDNPHRATYLRGLAEAEKYREQEEPVPTTDSWQVSPQMRQHMADRGDVPLGDEVYRYQDARVKISECPGGKGLYVYNSQANRVYIADPK